MSARCTYLKHLVSVIFLPLSLLPTSAVWSQEENSGSTNNVNDFDLDDLFIIEITVASKRLEKPADAPGIINVISRKEIDHYGGPHLFDIISRLPGLIPGHNPVLPSSMTSMRGMNSAKDADLHILFLLNGRPIREQLSGGLNYPFLHNMPLNLVDHIEVIRGPGSVIYGTNAYAGVINVVTKHPDDVPTAVSLSYGSFATKTLNANWGYSEFGRDFSIGLRAEKSDGWELETPQTVVIDQATGTLNTAEGISEGYTTDTIGVAINGSYGNFSMNAFFSENDVDYAGVFAVHSADKPGLFNLNHYLLDLGYTFTLSEHWDLSVNGSYSSDSFSLRYEFDGAVFETGESESSDYLIESTASGPIGEKVNLLLGAVINNLTGEGSPYKKDYDTVNNSLFFQVDYSPWLDFKLIAGAQYNKPESVNANVSPRLGAIVHFYDNWGAKLFYGEAFRNAYPSEQFPDFPGLYFGNEALDPEIIKTVDAQLSYRDQKYYGAITLFHSKASDGISFTPSPSPQYLLTYANFVELDYVGAELEGYIVLSDLLRMQGSLSYTKHEDAQGNEDLFGQPNGMIKIGIEYDNKQGIRGGLFTYHAIDPATTTNPFALPINPEPDDYTIVTANIRFDLSYWFGFSERETTISLFVDNLLDEEVYQGEPATGSFYNSLPGHSDRAFYGTIEFSF